MRCWVSGERFGNVTAQVTSCAGADTDTHPRLEQLPAWSRLLNKKHTRTTLRYPMPDPFVAVTVAEAFMQFSQATVSAVSALPRFPPSFPAFGVVHSFQLRAYEQGTRARLVEAESELRALRHERDDALRDLNACKEQTRTCAAEVDRWKAEARHPTSLPPHPLRAHIDRRRIEHCLW